jgi:uncharacterized protein
MLFFDPIYLLFISPAILLMLWAQARISSTFHRGREVDARLSGAAAARYILDDAGLHDVHIEMVDGFLTDHYDPSARVIRLSPEVYHEHSASSVGIAAHEAGHALQHATNYAPLMIRNAAVPAARFGPMAFVILIIAGILMQAPGIMWLGIIAYCGLVFFQVINLIPEFDASNRAKRILDEHQIVDEDGAVAVRKVLNAAAWTYVAGALQSVLTLAYYILIVLSHSRND